MRASAETGIGGATHVAGIVGWPVEHSLSPAIHNAAFAAAGLDWAYVPLPVPPEGLSAALAGLAPLGFRGVNVTMPHKTETAALLEELSDDARLLRAVNTIVVRGDVLEGHNTDAPGFERFLRRDLGFDPAGAAALIYGVGGAAPGCAHAHAPAGGGRRTRAARGEAPAAPRPSLVVARGVPLVVVRARGMWRARSPTSS
ncbi:MAG: aroE [Actinomycetia bacterium]|nr:aroE [Actinomycetes bacterium]